MDIMATTAENTATTKKNNTIIKKIKPITLKNCYFYLHKFVVMAAVNPILLAVLV